MWNDWLEKGKSLAATIDKQLNESVGVDGSHSAATSSTGVANNAWNDDDFGEGLDDNDDDDGDEGPFKIISEEQHVAEIVPKQSESTIIPKGTNDEWADNEVIDFDAVITSSKEPLPSLSSPSMLSPITAALFSPVRPAPTTAVIVPPNQQGSNDRNDDTSELPSGTELPSGSERQSQHEIQTVLKPTQTMNSESDLQSHWSTEPEPASEPTPVPEPLTQIIKPQTLPETGENIGWEEELYDDDDDDDNDDDDDVEEQPTPELYVESTPESTIDQPIDDIAPEPMVKSQKWESASYSIDEPLGRDTITLHRGQVMPMTPATALLNESIGQIQNDQHERITLLQKEHAHTMAQLMTSHQANTSTWQSKIQTLLAQLKQREDQVTNKAEQMASMSVMHEREKEELMTKISDTKEEAKKRIQSAKERVDSMESKLKAAGSAAVDAAGQDGIIAALREEGSKLARKQADMEKAVRAAKGEARELMIQLEREKDANEKAQEKIGKLEADLKETKVDLTAARKGETLASKLETNLVILKEELERKTSANLDLNQQVKELKSAVKELKGEVEIAARGALLDSKRESSKIKKEHGDMLSEMELKLRSSEREASVREDALRQEVAELRKRWQDAVRRADALSMDVQNSTAPLLRQLESMERQNRSRVTAWAELETKLRTDLEENVIEVEKVTKERNELRVNHNRLQRMTKERDEELLKAKSLAEESTAKVEKLEAELTELETVSKKREEEYVEVQRLANEGVSRVRSDMMKTVVDSDERYRTQIDSVESDLKQERGKRTQLEEQVQKLLENVGLMAVPLPNAIQNVPRDKPQKELRASEGQADILASTLAGLGDESDDGYESEDDAQATELKHINEVGSASGMRSFAAMEELIQRLKASTVELEALRSSLANSEKTRASLVEELSETRQAKEKLPLFEAKVRELTDSNHEMELEIKGLQDDINDTRHLYRVQLNALLEEKASFFMKPSSNGNERAPEETNHNSKSLLPVVEVEIE